jgi:hypothetical protein
MRDVRFLAGEEVVDADHLMSVFQEPIAKM